MRPRPKAPIGCAPRLAPALTLALVPGCITGGWDGTEIVSGFHVSLRTESRPEGAVAVTATMTCMAKLVGERDVVLEPRACRPTDWCLYLRWFPAAAANPPPREEEGRLVFDWDMIFEGQPLEVAETCLSHAGLADGESLSVVKAAAGPISFPGPVVIDARVGLGRAGDPDASNDGFYHRDILPNP